MRKGRGKGFTTDALFLFLAFPAIKSGKEQA
jgi:hypothetical protein